MKCDVRWNVYLVSNTVQLVRYCYELIKYHYITDNCKLPNLQIYGYRYKIKILYSALYYFSFQSQGHVYII